MDWDTLAATQPALTPFILPAETQTPYISITVKVYYVSALQLTPRNHEFQCMNQRILVSIADREEAKTALSNI